MPEAIAPLPAIRVVLVEDDEGVRESVAELLRRAKTLACVGQFGSAEAALRELPDLAPDVAMLDINLPKMSGIQCARQIKAEYPATQILMLTMFDDSEQVFQALRAGANGYLLKRSSPKEIVQAIHDVHSGGAPMSRQVARKVVEFFQGLGARDPGMRALTPRENEVLAHLARGLHYKEIGESLGISVETVRGHLHNIYRKLHVESRTEAVVKFLGH
jgi:DNA-binding NarL/FixJ family response regulator